MSDDKNVGGVPADECKFSSSELSSSSSSSSSISARSVPSLEATTQQSVMCYKGKRVGKVNYPYLA